MHKLISTHSSIRNSPWILALIYRDNIIKYWISKLRTSLAFSRFPLKKCRTGYLPPYGWVGVPSCPGITQMQRAKSSHQPRGGAVTDEWDRCIVINGNKNRSCRREKCQARNPYSQIEFLTGNGKKKKKKSLLIGNLIYTLPIEDFFCQVTKEMQLKTAAPQN